mmetsp:Transcript_27339/g.76346  ORF Transcript_27339/g.76346 Transcript_27339/m.76346 type:complete len:413 (-) Transcript_27339:119-1357(-)
MPAVMGSRGSPENTSKPTMSPFSCCSCTAISDSCTSWPLFSARILGMMSMASAKAWTPSFFLPSTVLAVSVVRWWCSATSRAPAPGTTWLSSSTFFTALNPSLTASLICAMVWSFWPLMRIVLLLGFFTCSTKVYFSSPRMCSSTSPAHPSTSGHSSSQVFTATPPQANTRRSMLRFLARRRATMPAFWKASREMGSMPFWLITTKPLSGSSPHTFFFSAMTCATRSSVHFRSASTSFSRWSALEYMKPDWISDLSYSKEMLQVRMKQSSTRFFMSGWRAPWSSTRPRTSRVSLPILCRMCITSTMCRSRGSSGWRTESTASVTMAASCSAMASFTLVFRLEPATQSSCSRSLVSMGFFTVSRKATAALFATSNPSTMTRGWTPSLRNPSARFNSSPMSSTMLVVPSPVMSS